MSTSDRSVSPSSVGGSDVITQMLKVPGGGDTCGGDTSGLLIPEPVQDETSDVWM